MDCASVSSLRHWPQGKGHGGRTNAWDFPLYFFPISYESLIISNYFKIKTAAFFFKWINLKNKTKEEHGFHLVHCSHTLLWGKAAAILVAALRRGTCGRTEGASNKQPVRNPGPQSNNPQGTESCWRPWEWARKQILPNEEFREVDLGQLQPLKRL